MPNLKLKSKFWLLGHFGLFGLAEVCSAASFYAGISRSEEVTGMKHFSYGILKLCNTLGKPQQL